MLYTITINQEAAIRSGLPLKVQHLAVIAVLKNMFASPDVQEVWHDGKSYKWVAIQLIIDELPLFDFEKRRVSGLISELEDMKVIMRHPENQKLRKSFFRAGASWNNLFSTMQKIAEPSMQKNADHYAKNCIVSMQKIADNHNTNNHNTNNHNTTYKKNTDFDFSSNELPTAVIENRKKALTPTTPAPFDSDKAKESWGQWISYLVEKGKAPVRQTLEAHSRELRNHSESTALAMIKQAIEKGNTFPYPITTAPKASNKPELKRTQW